MAATTAAIVGTVTALAGTAMSFTQAAQQQRNIRTAQAKADQAMQEAQKRLDVNYMDTLSIQRQVYKDAQEAALVQGQQAVDPELGRAAIANVGRVQALMNKQQMDIAAAQGQEKQSYEQQSALEDARLDDIRTQIKLGIVQGAQQAMADSSQASAAAMAQGFQGLASAAGQAASIVPLYQTSAAAKSLNRAEADYSKMIKSGNVPSQYKKADGTVMSFQEAFGVAAGNANYGTMNPFEFRDKVTQQGRDFVRQYNPLNVDLSKMNQQQASPASVKMYNLNQPFNALELNKLGLNQYAPNYQFGRSLPASMGGQYDPFGIF